MRVRPAARCPPGIEAHQPSACETGRLSRRCRNVPGTWVLHGHRARPALEVAAQRHAREMAWTVASATRAVSREAREHDVAGTPNATRPRPAAWWRESARRRGTAIELHAHVVVRPSARVRPVSRPQTDRSSTPSRLASTKLRSPHPLAAVQASPGPMSMPYVPRAVPPPRTSGRGCAADTSTSRIGRTSTAPLPETPAVSSRTARARRRKRRRVRGMPDPP